MSFVYAVLLLVMSMRVITGTARGKRLTAPEGTDTRPTPDRVKESIFSAIQFDIEGRRVLDLFAGSGQLGIEALSRGAQSAVFIDASKAAAELIRKNLASCGLSDKARVLCTDYAAFAASCRERFDIIFLDPPYKSGHLVPAVNAVIPLASDYGSIICEHPPEIELPESTGAFSVSRRYRYGKVLITVYRKEVRDEG